MNQTRKLALLAFALIALTACTAGTESSEQAANGGTVSQFLLGFWHGLIGLITLIGEVINAIAPGALPWTVHFYEPQGTGVVYDVGFFLGVVAGPSVLWTGTSRRRRV